MLNPRNALRSCIFGRLLFRDLCITRQFDAILLLFDMQKKFRIQARLFVHSAYFDHPILHGLDGAEAVIDWSELEWLMSSIYGSKTGRPSYPLLTLFRALLLGICYRLSDEQLA
jgi:hypothetical protein